MGQIFKFQQGMGSSKAEECSFILNGRPYYANGFNAYWLMYVASDPSQRNKVTSAFEEAVSHGLTVARTWAFSDGGYQPLQVSFGTYNQQMFQVPTLFSSVLLHCPYYKYESLFLFLQGAGFCNI